MKLLNILCVVVFGLAAGVHLVLQVPASWLVSGLMATALALHALEDVLND